MRDISCFGIRFSRKKKYVDAENTTKQRLYYPLLNTGIVENLRNMRDHGYHAFVRLMLLRCGAELKKVKSIVVGPLKFVKINLFVILPLLTHIFNACITTSSFPSQWKWAKVISKKIYLLSNRPHSIYFSPVSVQNTARLLLFLK